MPKGKNNKNKQLTSAPLLHPTIQLSEPSQPLQSTTSSDFLQSSPQFLPSSQQQSSIVKPTDQEIRPREIPVVTTVNIKISECEEIRSYQLPFNSSLTVEILCNQLKTQLKTQIVEVIYPPNSSSDRKLSDLSDDIQLRSIKTEDTEYKQKCSNIDLHDNLLQKYRAILDETSEKLLETTRKNEEIIRNFEREKIERIEDKETNIARILIYELLQKVTDALVRKVVPSRTLNFGNDIKWIHFITYKEAKAWITTKLPENDRIPIPHSLQRMYPVSRAKEEIKNYFDISEYDTMSQQLTMERTNIAHKVRKQYGTKEEYLRVVEVARRVSGSGYFQYGEKLLKLALLLYPNKRLQDIINDSLI